MKLPKGRLSGTGLRCPTSLLSTMGLRDIICLCGWGLLSTIVLAGGAQAFSPKFLLPIMGLCSIWLVVPGDWIPKGLAVLLTTGAGLASVRCTSLYTLVGVVTGARPDVSCSADATRVLGCMSMSRELDMRSAAGVAELERGAASLVKALVTDGGADTLSIRRTLDLTSSAGTWGSPSSAHTGVLGLESRVPFGEHCASDEFCWAGVTVAGGFWLTSAVGWLWWLLEAGVVSVALGKGGFWLISAAGLGT